MEGDVVDDVDVDEVAEKAGPSSEEISTLAEQLGSETEPSAVEELQQKLETKINDTAAKIGEALDMNPKFGPDPGYTESVIEDSSKSDPETADGKKLKSFVDEASKKLGDAVEKIKESNGEKGKDLKDSPKSKLEIFKKYGKIVLVLALAIGALLSLKEMAKSMTGCSQIATASDEPSTPTKVGCSNDTVPGQSFKQCSCQGVKLTKCAAPDCGGDNGINYYWKTYTPLEVLTGIPGMLASGIVNPITTDSMQLIKTIAIYGGVFLIILIIGYIFVKNFKKRTTK
jgi:hypothetical protein